MCVSCVVWNGVLAKKQRVTEVVRDTLCGVACRCGVPAVVLRFVSVVFTLDMAPGVFFNCWRLRSWLLFFNDNTDNRNNGKNGRNCGCHEVTYNTDNGDYLCN